MRGKGRRFHAPTAAAAPRQGRALATGRERPGPRPGRARTQRRPSARRLSGAAWLHPRPRRWFRPRHGRGETWALLAAAFGSAPPVAFDDRLYEAAPQAILQAVKDTAPEAATLLVIGHNPGMAELGPDAGRLGRRRDARAARPRLSDLGAGHHQLRRRKLGRRSRTAAGSSISSRRNRSPRRPTERWQTGGNALISSPCGSSLHSS